MHSVHTDHHRLFSLPLFAFLFVSLMCVSNMTLPQGVSAAEDTTNATDASQETIKDRLKKVVDEKKDQIKGITDGAEKRGFIGTVKRVSEETLTVDTPKGTEILTIDDNVTVLQDGKSFTVSNIEIDSQVVIMGYQKGEDFSPRRVLVLKSPLQSVTKSVEVGTIKKIDKQSIMITTRSNQDKIFALNTKTVLEDSEGNTLKLNDIDTEQSALLITVAEDSKTQSIKDSSGRVVRLHLTTAVPEATQKTEKATPTTTPKSSAKATATPKVTAKP